MVSRPGQRNPFPPGPHRSCANDTRKRMLQTFHRKLTPTRWTESGPRRTSDRFPRRVSGRRSCSRDLTGEWNGVAAPPIPKGIITSTSTRSPGSCKWSKHAGPTARPSRVSSRTTWRFVRLVTAWIARATRLADSLPLSTSAAASHASNCHSSPNRAPGGCPPSIRSPTLSATPFWITCSAWTNLPRRVLKLEMLRWRPQTQLRRMRSPDSVAGSTRKVIPPSSRPGAR